MRVGAIAGAVLALVILGPLAPIFFTYIGADLAYRAGKMGDWARMPVAIGGFAILFLLAVACAAAAGAAIGFLVSKAKPS